jgi:hypothetical protein
MTDRKTPEKLGNWLRQGDPAASGPGLSPDDAQRMRRNILAAEPEPRRMPLLPLAALTTAVALSLVMFWPREATPPADRLTYARPAATDAEPASRRQIQFTTDGGTRIVWTLDPGFKL